MMGDDVMEKKVILRLEIIKKKPDLTMFLYSKDKRKLIGEIVFVYIYFFTLRNHFNNM